MKKVVCLFLVLALIFTFISCSNREIEVDPQEWGSFSPNKTTSYDNKYYALQTVEWVKYIRTSLKWWYFGSFARFAFERRQPVCSQIQTKYLEIPFI